MRTWAGSRAPAGAGIGSTRWSRWTGRRSGRTTSRASSGTSTTSASGARRSRPPRPRWASWTAATALLFPSGAGATTALALSLLEPGDTIALARGGYYGTGVTFAALSSWGLRVVEFDQTGAPPESVQLVWLEAPSNPYLTMPNLEAAAAHPAPVVVDATVATPVHLRPLEHGADFVLHSATKYLAGHDDALLGAVVCRDGAAAEELRTFRGRTGIVAAPDPAWLLLRGLKTLELRVRRQTETAAFLAERLRAHPAVETVRYPGLGGLLSFDVADAETARKVETSTHVIVNASSLGGVTT